jgi:SAM-dependent methyltransferase
MPSLKRNANVSQAGVAPAPDVKAVQSYWESNPLLSHEFDEPGSPKFFDELDRVKREDIERFALKYWDFNGWRDKSVLDIGCGPGWVTVRYAAGGAKVTSVDLTNAAVDLCKKHLVYRGLTADVRQANAEELPFPDNHFDMVFSSGVLHHTPDTQKSFRESIRVLKPGGVAKITLYRLGILHSPAVFGVTRGVMKVLGVKHPGADLGREATSVADFIRQYDGKDNPIGIAKSDKDWAKDLQAVGYRVRGWESHFFPKRFIPTGKIVPSFVHHALDRGVGTMVYFQLTKP